MQDEIPRRLDGIERNASDLAGTVTRTLEEIAGIKQRIRELEEHHQDYCVRSAAEAERDKALQSDIANIKEDIKSIKSLGKWALTTFIGAIILAFVAFRREDVHGGFRLKNAKDLLRYGNSNVPLGDRLRLLGALDEHGSTRCGQRSRRTSRAS